MPFRALVSSSLHYHLRVSSRLASSHITSSNLTGALVPTSVSSTSDASPPTSLLLKQLLAAQRASALPEQLLHMASCSKAGGGDGPPPTPKSCIRVLMNPLSPPSASSFDALRSYSSASNGEATLLKAAAQYFSQIAADDTPFDCGNTGTCHVQCERPSVQVCPGSEPVS